MNCKSCDKVLHNPVVGSTCSACTATKPASGKGKSLYSVHSSLEELRSAIPIMQKEVEMKTIKVKSNSVRNQIMSFGDLYLTFDGNGVAELPAHRKAYFKQYMIAKPNRYTLLEEEKKSEPKKAEVAKSEDPKKSEAPKAEEDSDSPKEEESSKKASSNSTKKSKKSSSKK